VRTGGSASMTVSSTSGERLVVGEDVEVGVDLGDGAVDDG
jgi:hypothetical protein